MAEEPETVAGSRLLAWLLLPVGIAFAVTATVYLATQVITPDINTSLFGQSATETFSLKSWLANGVLALAAFQLYSALWIYGRMPWRTPGWLAGSHRASGYAAIALSLPIAYHCLFAYGFRDVDRRITVHSIAGCFFYGAFAAKVIVVRARRLPGWTLPLAGGTMLTLIAVLWYSSALWYFNGFSSPGLSSSMNVARPTYRRHPTSTSGPAGTSAAPRQGIVAVTYENISITPANLTVKSGSTVKWTNLDATLHNVAITSGPATFSSPALKTGGTYSATFAKPGLYRYLCTFHPQTMVGTITVVPTKSPRPDGDTH
jgi:plastocyanin